MKTDSVRIEKAAKARLLATLLKLRDELKFNFDSTTSVFHVTDWDGIRIDSIVSEMNILADALTDHAAIAEEAAAKAAKAAEVESKRKADVEKGIEEMARRRIEHENAVQKKIAELRKR